MAARLVACQGVRHGLFQQRFELGHLLPFAALADLDQFQQNILDHDLAVLRAFPPSPGVGIVAGLEMMLGRRPAISNLVISLRLAFRQLGLGRQMFIHP